VTSEKKALVTEQRALDQHEALFLMVLWVYKRYIWT